jgi:hypothetical protein
VRSTSAISGWRRVSFVERRQGDLILMKVNEIPTGAVPSDVERLPDGGIQLPGGHIIRPHDEE